MYLSEVRRSFYAVCNITSHRVWGKLAELPPLLIYLECAGVFMRSFYLCNITLHKTCDRTQHKALWQFYSCHIKFKHLKFLEPPHSKVAFYTHIVKLCLSDKTILFFRSQHIGNMSKKSRLIGLFLHIFTRIQPKKIGTSHRLSPFFGRAVSLI